MPRRPFALLPSRLLSRAPKAARRRALRLESLEERRLFDAAPAGDLDPGTEQDAQLAEDTALAAPPTHARVAQSDAADPAADSDADRVHPAVRREVVFIDAAVEDRDTLLADLLAEADADRDFEVVLIDGGDGVQQIADALADLAADGRGGVDAVHLVAHGEAGAVKLGDVWLSDGTLDRYAGTLAQWGNALTADGDLLIYGCDLASTARGRDVASTLSRLTGADVAASDDATGHRARGGDWNLEFTRGETETRVAFSRQAQNEWRFLLEPGPTVTLAGGGDVPIGQDFTLTAAFDNTGADTGYGPFLDVLIPANGADGAAGTDTADGVTFLGATYLGSAVTATVFTFPDDGGGTGSIEHPYAVDAAGDPLVVTGTAGDRLVVLELPFGSVTPTQPEIAVEMRFGLSELADLGEPLDFTARAGFRYGEDPLDNPASDPSLVSDVQTDSSAWAVTRSVTPSLITLSKAYVGPENETATGPNFPRTYRVAVDIADGQTVVNLDVTDALPDNVTFTRIVSVEDGGGNPLAFTDNSTAPTDRPTVGGEVIATLASVTGAVGTDVVLEIEFHVPEFSAGAYDAGGTLIANPEPFRIIPRNGEDDGAASLSDNQARAVGDWTPADGRDAGGTDNAVADPAGVEHTLDGKALAVQKSVAVVGGGAVKPGATLEYTLAFQISDYFTFDDLVLDDVFTDGQRFDFGQPVTFTVTDRDGTTAGQFTVRGVTDADGGETLVVDETKIDRTDDAAENPASDGTTSLRFDLSEALRDNGEADGVLRGGRAASPDAGPATGTVTFRTVIQEEFADTFPSGDRSVDQGDSLSNDVTVTGTARDNADVTQPADGEASFRTETDGSAAGVTIVQGSFTKALHAVNGNTGLPAGTVRVSPGDVVTYALTYDLPSTDFEQLVLTDYLPLPLLVAGDPDADGGAGPDWRFDAAFAGLTPPAGTVTPGAADTFFNSDPGTSDYFSDADITVDSVGNSVSFDFGTFDDPASGATTIQLLFSVTVSDAPFADGLFLTNIARASENSTQFTPSSQDGIVQVSVDEPDVRVTKGVIDVDSPNAVLSDTPHPAGVTFAGAGSADPSFTGTITSGDLAAQAIDADVSGLDAGDTVRYAVVLENLGGADAYDLIVEDLLPAGFEVPAGGLNLQIRDGNGNLLTWTGLDTDTELDVFGSGLEIHDPVSVYLASDAGDELILMRSRDDFDPATNTTAVGEFDSANPTSVEAIARNFAGDLFGADQNRLGQIDLADGSFDEIGFFGTANHPNGDILIDEVNGLSFHPATGKLYGIHKRGGTAPELLIEIDLATGAVVADAFGAGKDYIELDTAGAGVGNDIDDFTIDTAGTFYATTAARLIRLDVNLGAGTATVADVGAFGANIDDMEGLSVDKHGRLFGSTGNSGTGVLNTLFEIDKATGAATNGRSLGTGGDFEGLAAYDSAALGSLDDLDAATAAGDGSNILVVTYDLTVADTVTAAQSGDDLRNEAALSRAAARDGGTDQIAVDRVDSAQAATAPFDAVKSIVATSESHTGFAGGSERVTVGEVVRYRLVVEVPEGTHAGFELRDLLPDGLTYLEDGTGTVAFVSDGGFTSTGTNGLGSAAQQTGDEGNLASITPVHVLADAAITEANGSPSDTWHSGTDPVFALGDLQNLDSDANKEYVVLEFNALAANSGVTNQNNTEAGAFRVQTDAGPTLTSNSVSVRIAEPLVALSKSVDDPSADAGDTVTFTLTLTAAGSNGRSDAFDVRLTDTLPAGLTNIQNLSAVAANGSPVGVTPSVSGDTVTVAVDDLPKSAAVTVTFDATLTQAVEPDDLLNNRGELTWTSLKGDFGDEAAFTGDAGTSSNLRTLAADSAGFDADGDFRSYDTVPGNFHGERTGAGYDPATGTSGGTNDHGTRDFAGVTVPAAVYAKSLFATGEGFTTGSDVAVGETVTYALRVELPEGTTTGLTVTDLLPPGLEYLSASLHTTAAGSGGLLAADFDGTVSAPAASGAGADGGNGEDVTFTFAPVTVDGESNAAQGDDNAFLLLVTTRTTDVPGNRGTAPQTTLTNAAAFDTDGDGTPESTESAAPVTVVEGDLQVTKTFSPDGADAGDTVTVTLDVTNAGTADLFEFTLTDDLADGLFTSIAEGTTPAGFSYSLSGDTVTYSGSGFAAGQSETFTFTAVLTSSVSPNQEIPNTATATGTSLPGTRAGERTDTADGSDALEVGGPTFTKTRVATSDAATAGGDVAVGESVTWALTVTLPEGTTPGLTVTDLIPPGLDYTAFSVVTDAASSFGLLTADFAGTITGTPSAGGGAADGDDVTFTFGRIDLTVDNDGANNSFLVLVETTVSDVPGNEGLLPGRTTLTNAAQLDIDGDGQGPTTSNNASVRVVEPELSVTKTASVATADGGDEIVYTLTIAHTAAGSGPARDLDLTDLLADPALELVAGSVDASTGDIAGTVVTGNGGSDDTVRVTADRLDVGDDLIVTFRVTLTDAAQYGDAVPNTAAVGYDGLGGAGGRAATGDGSRSITVASPTVDKTLTATGVETAGNAREQAVIGELVRYTVTLTLPEGNAPDAHLLDDLADGLEFVELESVVATGDVNSDRGPFANTATFAPTVTAGGGAAGGDRLDFDFGTLANPSDDAGGPQTVTLTYLARVSNTADEQSGDALPGTAASLAWDSDGTPRTADSADADGLTLLEPVLNVTHTVTDTTGDAGDSVAYEVVVSHDGASNADAFDLTFADPLPDDVTVNSFTVTHSTLGDVTASFFLDGGTNTLRNFPGSEPDLRLGETLTVAVNGTIDESAEAGDALQHTAAVTWTSLDDDDPADGTAASDPGERTGADGEGGAVNDHAAGAPAAFLVDTPAFVKTLVGSGQTDAGNAADQAVVGETVRYALTVTVPEGTTADAVITDTLGIGLAFDQIVSVTAFSDGTPTGQLGSTNGSFTPSAAGDGDSAAQVLTFDLGTLTNANTDDAAAETFVIVYDAVVLNTAANQGADPPASAVTFAGTARLDYTADGTDRNTADSSPATVELREPVLTVDTEVSDDTPNLGDTVTYTLTIEHDPASDTTAHDLRLTDLLPPGVTLEAGSVNVTGATLVSDATAGNTLDVTLDELAVGGTAVVTVRAQVTTDPAERGNSFADDADLTWTGLPGNTAGERTGADGAGGSPDDYADSDSDSLTVVNPDLAVTIDDGETVLAPGETRTYTVTVTNNGTGEATGVSVGIPLPTDRVSFDATDDAANVTVDGSGNLTWTPPATLDPGDTATLLVTVTALDPQPAGADDVTLAATVTADQIEPTPADNADDDTDLITAAPDLFLSQDDGGVSTTAGGDVAYTLTFGNRGSQDATGVTITQTLPPGSTFDAANNADGWTDNGDGTFTLTVGDLAAGDTLTAFFPVTTDDDLPAGQEQLFVTGTIADDGLNGADENPGDETGTDVTPLDAVADLTVTVTPDVAATTAGGTVVYTFDYTNAGDQDAAQAVIRTTVPAGTAFDAANSDGRWTHLGGGVYELDLGTVAADGSDDGAVLFAVTVTDPVAAGREEITDSVSIEDRAPTAEPDPTPANNTDTVDTPLSAFPDLTLTKTDGGGTFAPGETVVYTLTYANAGDQDASGVVLTEVLPQYTSFTATGSTPGWADNGDGTFSLSLGTVAGGGVDGSVTFAVTVDATLPAGVTQTTNSASIADDGTGGPDATPGDNDAADDTPLGAFPDLVLTKSDGGATVAPGGTVVYTLAYANTGDQAATGVTITETLPAGTSFTTTGSTPGWADAGGGQYVFSLGTLAAGGSGTVDFAVTVDALHPAGRDELANSATLADDGTNGPDANPGDETGTDTTPLDAAPDLYLTKTDGGATAAPNGTVVYTLTYGNRGSQGATGIVLTEALPAGTTFDAANSTGGWVDAGGGTFTLAVADLGAGEERTADFAVTVDAAHPAGRHDLANTAGVADDGTNGADETPGDGSGSDDTPLDAAPDLSVAVTDGGVTAVAGGSVTYTVDYANAGPQDATGVTLTQTLPAGTSYDPSANSFAWVDRGDDAFGQRRFTLAVGNLDVGDTGQVTFVVTVEDPVAAGRESLSDTVSVADDGLNGAEAITANNFADEPTPLSAFPDLFVTVDDGDAVATPGDPHVFTVSYGNTGDQHATGVTLTQTPPPGTTFDPNASDPRWTVQPDGTFTLTLGDLDAGETGGVPFAVLVTDPVAAGRETIETTSAIGDDGTGGPDPTPADNVDADDAPLDATPDLAVTIDDGRTVAGTGDTLVYAVSFANAGDQDASGTVLTVTPPPHTTFDPNASAPAWTAQPDGTFTRLVGEVPADGTGSFDFAVTVDPAVPAGVDELTATAAVADDGTGGADPTPANNFADDADTLDAAPDLRVTLGDDGVTAEPGGPVVYTLDYANAGDQTATGVILTQTVPDGATFDPSGSDPRWVAQPDGTFRLTLSDPLAAGESGSVTFAITADPATDALREELAADATVADDGTNGPDRNPADNADPEATPLDAEPDLSVAITDSGATAEPGGPVAYTVSFANGGDQTASVPTLTLAVPEGTAFDPAGSDPRFVVNADGTVSLELDPLNPGDAGTVTFAVTADDPATAGREVLLTDATIVDAGSPEPDPTPANNFADEDTPLLAVPDLVVTLTNPGPPAVPGGPVVYTVDYANDGDQNSSGTVLTFTPPPHTTFDPSASDPRWVEQPDGSFSLTLADPLPADGTGSLTVAVWVDDAVPAGVADLTADASITDDGRGGPDPTPANNASSSPVPLTATPDLVVTVDDGRDVLRPGDEVTWTVTVANVGDQGATGVVLTDAFPSSLLENVAVSGGGTLNPATGEVRWEVGDLPAGEAVTFTVTGTVIPELPFGAESLPHDAVATDDGTNGPAPTTGNNFADDLDLIDAAPAYAVTVDDGVTVAEPGDPLVHVVTVTNSGDQTGGPVTVVIALPPEVLSVNPADLPPGASLVLDANGDPVAGTVTVTLDPLDPGDSVTVELPTRVNEDVDGDIAEFTVQAAAFDGEAFGAGADLDDLNGFAPSGFTYDSFRKDADEQWGLLPPERPPLVTKLAPLPVDPLFSGLAEPGTTLVGRIYDADGNLLGERQVVADTGGNWVMSFPNAVIHEQPHRMEVRQTAAVHASAVGETDAGFNLRRYYQPTLHATLFFTESPSVGAVFRGTASATIGHMHAANLRPLAFGWNAHGYELNATGSGSGTV